MRRLPRWLRSSLIALVLLVLLAWLGRTYLVSKHAAAQVAAHLEKLSGGPVEIGEVEIGFNGSLIRGVQLFELATSIGLTNPWVVVGEAQTDADLWSLLGGQAGPRRMSLTGAVVTLRLDADGHLLTRLPSLPLHADSEVAVPDIDIQNGELILRQEGRPDLALHNITASLRTRGSELVLEGSFSDPVWGEWTATGSATSASRAASLDVRSRRSLHVTQEMLIALPFVPLKTWKHVQAEGDTEATIRLSAQPDQPLHYHIALTPRSAKVHVTSIDLDGTDAAGTVVIEDKTVHLRDVSGHTADGVMAVESDMDFRQHPYRLNFSVTGRDLEVGHLPQTWKLPPLLSGRVGGMVDLQIRTGDEHTQIQADGQGEIRKPKIGGIPTHAIRMRVTNDGSGFRFQPVPYERTK